MENSGGNCEVGLEKVIQKHVLLARSITPFSSRALVRTLKNSYWDAMRVINSLYQQSCIICELILLQRHIEVRQYSACLSHCEGANNEDKPSALLKKTTP